ncbi:tRNA (adenosine(37)-N6)-threonylcarbamoyltransferase complex ATPase subunit type 1 TsaE [Candidatus Peregrinibacteria bacterium]|nr:tRNA (adenosine(37)-N6)-threonylcarbamoyltransferase complex ATPase subunit type 1 TsaE [Candidatus Peregrinibacteria bacterium]
MNSFLSSNAVATEKAGRELGLRVHIAPEWGKIVLLSGELGTGKTTFSRGFFDALGIPKEDIKSPTFTYLEEYKTENRICIHGDLYRLKDTPNSAHILESEIEKIGERGDILLLEWSDLLDERILNLFEGTYISVHFAHGNSESERNISLTFHNALNIPKNKIPGLMEEFMTPQHIQKHIEMVTHVATILGNKLFQSGVPLDIELITNGALCHDLLRYVDFKDLNDVSRFQEEVTDEKIALWKSVRQKYEKFHHGSAMADVLRSRGYSATADVVEAHMTGMIFREKPFTWEEKVVYYADKRVLHDEIVSLKKRFEDGRKRYAHEASPNLEKKVSDLEQEIFENLDIAPEEIR